MKQQKIETLAHYLKTALDSENPRENLDGVATLEVAQWLEKETGVVYTPNQVIKALKGLLYELPASDEIGYETKDGKFSYSNMQNVNNRNLPKYIWFFY